MKQQIVVSCRIVLPVIDTLPGLAGVINKLIYLRTDKRWIED